MSNLNQKYMIFHYLIRYKQNSAIFPTKSLSNSTVSIVSGNALQALRLDTSTETSSYVSYFTCMHQSSTNSLLYILYFMQYSYFNKTTICHF